MGIIVESTDGGNTFTGIYTPPHQYSTDYLRNAVAIGTAYDSPFLFVDSSREVNYTVDDGKHWNPYFVGGKGIGNVNSLEFSDATLYTTSESGIFSFARNGQSKQLSMSLPAGTCYGIAVNGNTMCTFLRQDVYGGRAILYVTSDGGNSWTQQHVTDSIQLNLACATGQGLAVATGAGVFTSTDNGATWAAHNTGLHAQNISILHSYNGALYAATRNNSAYTGDASSVSGGIFKSTDDGATWTQLLGDTVGVKSFDFNGPTMFVGGVASNLPLHYLWLRSTNDGQTWANFGGDSITSYFVAGGSVFALIASRVTYQTYLARSTDDGNSWTAIGSPMGPYTNSLATSISGMYEAGGVFYADLGLTQQAGGGMYSSNDGGQTWKLLTVPGDYMNGFYTSPYVYQVGDYFVLAQGYFNQYTAPKLFETTNNASTWQVGGNGLPIQQVLSMAESNNTQFAGTGLLGGNFNFGVDSGAVYSSSDGGVTWKNFSDGLPQESVSSLAVMDGKLFAGLWGGSVWYRSVPGSNSVQEVDSKVAPITIVPNPSTHRITIDGLHGASMIRIVDAMGRTDHLKILMNRPTISFNVSDLPSGVYCVLINYTNGEDKVERFTILH